MLKVTNGFITDNNGSLITLRGVCVGGWMHKEDFINGYPGVEHELHEMSIDILGEKRALFLFDCMAEHFFNEDDVTYIKACGANVIRLPLNYRSFESDSEPFSYIESGFKRLNLALTWCEKHELYVILDMHAVQGYQSTDWHCDNASRRAMLWNVPYYQDRFVALWEEFARRYEGRTVIAGYNLMNEPHTKGIHGRLALKKDSNWSVINRLYRRTVEAIRLIDKDHIIFLEGDYYSQLFSGLEEPFADNLVYSSHNYSVPGSASTQYPGVIGDERWNREMIVKEFEEHEGTIFARKYGVPLWVGEFASVYTEPEMWDSRLAALDDQIGVFEDFGAHWTVWTYKDLGFVGMVMPDPQCEYLQRISPVIDKITPMIPMTFLCENKESMHTKMKIRELADVIKKIVGNPDIDSDYNAIMLELTVMHSYVCNMFQPEYIKLFMNLQDSEISRIMQSFDLKNCVERPVTHVLSKYFRKNMIT